MIIKQLVGSGSTIAIGRIINILSLFAFNVLLAKLLSKQGVADFFITFSLISFFSVLVTFGSGNIALKMFSDTDTLRTNVSAGSLLKAFIKFNFLVTIFVIIFFLLLNFAGVIELLEISYSTYHLIILTCWFWSLGLQTLLSDIFRAFGQFVLMVACSGAISSLLNVTIIALTYLLEIPISFNFIICLIMMNTLVITLISLWFARQTVYRVDKRLTQVSSDFRSKSSNQLVKEIITESTPSFINKFGLYLTALADIWIVSLFFSKGVVADYAISAKLAAALSVFLSIANGVVPNYIGKLRAYGNEVIEQFLRVLATLVFIPTFSLFLVLFFMSDSVIQWLFGEAYLSAVSFLQIILLAHLINVFVGSSSNCLVMEGKNKQLMRISITTGTITVLVAIICGTLGYGEISIAWAFSIGAIVRHISVYYTATKLCGVNTAVYCNPFSFIKNFKELYSRSLSMKKHR